MKFEDAKLVYQYFVNDYDVHDLVVTFDDEEVAIQFSVNNIMEEKGKRYQRLYDLEIAVLYDSIESYVVHDQVFWDKLVAFENGIEAEVAVRVKELPKKS